MQGQQVRTVAVSALVGAVVATATTALAATGGNWILGQPNTASSTTGLTATTSGRALDVVNDGTGSGIGVTVPAGAAPLAINASAGKALNLNADRIDGFDGATLVRKGATAIGVPAAPIGVVDARNGGTGAGVRGVSGHASGAGVRGVNTAGGLAGLFDGKVRIDGALECPGCTVPNAETVGGRTVAELRPRMLAGPQVLTDHCDTPGTWLACSNIPLTVPAGKTYAVTVLAQASMYEANAENRVRWCASIRDASTSVPNCVAEERGIIARAGDMEAMTAVTTRTLGAGNWVLSGAVNSSNPLDFLTDFDFGHAQTYAIVTDVS